MSARATWNCSGASNCTVATSTPPDAAKYIVITPIRNEAAQLDENVRSMVAQTIVPAEWILVDDGSTDSSGEIADRWSSRVPWISVIHRSDRGRRSQGTGVIEAFYEGYDSRQTDEWEYVVKLDGDILLEPQYFERCFDEFAKYPQLGIGGGIVNRADGSSSHEVRTPSFHVRGATKIYRRACWEALGGLIRSPGWDTLDELKAQFLGWNTRTFNHLPVRQSKDTGSVEGAWRNAVKNGLANYVVAYHPAFMAGKCLKRLGTRPYGVESLGLWVGFIGGYVRRAPRLEDRALIGYIRRQQLRRLCGLGSIWD